MQATLTVICSYCRTQLGQVDITSKSMPNETKDKINNAVLPHFKHCRYYQQTRDLPGIIIMRANLTVTCRQCDSKIGDVVMLTNDFPDQLQEKINKIMLAHRQDCLYYRTREDQPD
jgi:hypothetical protein